MAVDRGGLQYTIAVEDQFSANTKLFRAELRLAREEFALFKGEVASQGAETKQVEAGTQRVTKALSIEAAAQKKLAAEIRAVKVERATATLAEEQGVARGKEATAQLRLQAQAQAGLNSVLREGSAARRQQASLEAADARARQQRRATEQQILATQREQSVSSTALATQQIAESRSRNANLRVTQEQVDAQKQFTDGAGKLNNALKTTKTKTDQIATSGAKSNGVFRNLLFTFRRLIGVFAAFLIARQVVGAFVSLVTESIRFNAALEQAQLGIASVIAATGQITDAMGGATSSAQQFAIAQKEAQKQVQKLRADALATNATFEQLLETFQIAIGPGLAAGVDLDEIRKLTVRISQAATAIGLPQNQLAEEIRSILSGTIQLRTTRLAAVLGITNQDIKNAKELGTLTQFLTDKFKAFGIAGDASLQTFNVILTNLQDAFSQTFAAGGEGLFNTLKALLSEVQASVATVNKELNTVELNPKAVAVVEALLSGLQAAAEEGRTLLRNLNFDNALVIAQGIGDAFAGLAFLLRNAIEVFVSGLGRAAALLNVVLVAARAIGKAFNFLTGGFGGTAVGGLLKGAASLLVTFGAIRLSLLAIGKLVTFIFMQSLGKGVIAAIALFENLLATEGVLAKIQLLFQTNAIGLALTALAVVASILISQFGLLDGVLGNTSDTTDQAAASVQSLSDHFASLGGQIRGADDSGGKFGETLRQLQQDLRETLLASQIDISAIGLSGGVQQQAKIAGDALIEIQKKVFDLTNDQANAAATLLGIQRQRAAFERDIGNQTALTKQLIDQQTEAATNQLQITERQTQVESDLASARLSLEAARQQGAGQEFKDALTRVVALERESTALSESADKAKKLSDATGKFLQLQVQQGALTQEQADQIGAIADKRIDLGGQEASTQSQINDILAKRKDIEDTIQDAERARIRAVSIEENLRLSLENNQLAIQANGLRAVAAARVGLFDGDGLAQQLEAAKTELETLKESNSQRVFAEQLNLGSLASQLEKVRGTADEADVQRNLNLLVEQQGLNQAIANQKIADAERLVRVLQFQFEQPIRTGFVAAVEEFRTKAFSDFQNTLELFTTAFQGLTDFMANALVDAFDPTKKVDIRSRFAALLQDLARIIAEQQFAKLLANLLPSNAALEASLVTSSTSAAGILTSGGVAAGAALVAAATEAAAILAGGTATSAAAGSGGGIGSLLAGIFGAHEGGSVPHFATASMAHFGSMVQAFSGGGSVLGRGMTTPPPGVHSSDKVPAWLAEGEHVQPVSSVRMYGADLFEAFRRGAIPVNLARALLGASGAVSVRVGGSRGGGYAAGGIVAANRAAALRPQQVVPEAGLSVVAPTERSLDRLNAGGKAAQIRFFGENRAALRSAGGRRGR